MSTTNPSEKDGLIVLAKQGKRAEQFLRDLLFHMNSYHNHKENLAHLSIVLMGGLVVSILVMDDWPPKLATYSSYCPQLVASIGFTILWLSIHVYMRWQLRNRRSAAIMFNAVTRKLGEWVERPPTYDDFKSHEAPKSSDMAWYGDHFIVLKQGIRYKDNEKYYPNWLMFLYEREKNEIRIPAEYILTLASFVLWGLVILRTWYF